MIRTKPMLKLIIDASESHKLLPSVSLIQSSTTPTVELSDYRNSTRPNNTCLMMTETRPTIPDLTMIKSYYCSSNISTETSTPNITPNVLDDDDISISDDIPTLDLLLSFSAIDEDIVFQNNGYEKIDKICDTLQGELFKAINIDSQSTQNPHYVTIKKTDKTLFKQRIAIQDDINFCVSENILKESLILKYLTVDNQPIGDYIVKYIDFFESDTDYYLVMEYIESSMNLKQFVTVCHQYMENGTLSIKEYNKMIKYILWQLFVTIQWLHVSMHCCHLDLCAENVMLSNANFIKTKNGLSIDPQISVKLCDFGVAEVFKMEPCNYNNSGANNCFLCEKQGLSLENETYFAPKVFNGDIFDARCADNWSLGIILFECITNKTLYGPMDIYTDSIESGYWSLHHDKLKKYLAINNLLKYFNLNSFNLLNGLLNVDEHQRLKGIHILKHKFFKTYYKRYNHQITKKFKPSNPIKICQYNHFPFYH